MEKGVRGDGNSLKLYEDYFIPEPTGSIIMDSQIPGVKEFHYTTILVSPSGARVTKSPDRAAKVALARFQKQSLPKGVRLTPIPTTTRTQSLQSGKSNFFTEFSNIFRTGLKGRTKVVSHFTPDSYLQAVLNGKSKGSRLEYSNQHYVGNLSLDIPGVHNKEFYNAIKALQENPNSANLKVVNSYLQKIGGEPIELVNNQLVIPIPITYK